MGKDTGGSGETPLITCTRKEGANVAIQPEKVRDNTENPPRPVKDANVNKGHSFLRLVLPACRGFTTTTKRHTVRSTAHEAIHQTQQG